MPTPAAENQRTEALASLRKAIGNRAAMLQNPEDRTRLLSERAEQAFNQGAITSEDRRELLEWIDSGFAWAEEERVSHGSGNA
jgi:hypothetical protein